MNLNNKNGFKKYNWIQFGVWIVVIILLTTLILIPKNEARLQFLFIPFMILYIGAPIILITLNLVLYAKKKPKFNSFFVYLPMISLCFFQVMPFYYFFNSINETGQTFMYMILLPVMVYFITATIILRYKRMYSLKTHIILSLVGLGLFIVSFLISVYISYFYSVNW